MDLLIRKKLRDQISTSSALGRPLLSFLDGNDLEVNRIEVLRDGPDFFAYLALTDQLRTNLGLNGDELLLLVLHRSRQEQWFLAEIRQQLKEQDRITKSAVLVVSPDDRIIELCRAAFSSTQTSYKTAHVAITFKEIETASTQDQQTTLLYSAFKKQAFTINHFDTRGPVPDDLFGRNALVSQIESDIKIASEGVAVLGIRRVGKTSVLKRVLNQLQNDPSNWWLVGYYDAQADTVEANVQSITAKFQSSLRLAALERNSQIPAISRHLSAPDQLRATIDHLVTQAGFQVVLAIDEIEWLVPVPNSPNATQQGNEALALFGLLRSLKQQYGSRLALILCGINETLCEMPQINERPNPNLDWYRTHYVTLLAKEDTTAMLQTLGQRMGLSLNNEFLDEVWRAFGGHAYLARQFCSEAAKGLTERPGLLTKAHFEATYPDFMVRASNIFEDILKHLARFYPGEYNLLREIANGTTKAPKNTTTRHLRSYGLIQDQGGQLSIPLSALSEFVSTHTAEEVQRDRFKLISALGSGVTSTVWRAWDNDSQSDCALKVFQGEVPEASIREELKIMQDLGSRYIPKPLGVVKYENQSALAMELVVGTPLEAILQSDKKILGDSLVQLSYHLMEALKSIHPNIKRIQSLIESGELSFIGAVEFYDLKNRGHLHRDLKPSNIVVTSRDSWEIKIIDLGLTTAADRASLSRVGTPDYSPPDLGIVRWDASFDLYALGRILTRCVFGRLVSFGEVDAACTEINPEYRQPVSSFFKKALNPSAANRYASTDDMKSDWDSAVIAFI